VLAAKTAVVGTAIVGTVVGTVVLGTIVVAARTAVVVEVAVEPKTAADRSPVAGLAALVAVPELAA